MVSNQPAIPDFKNAAHRHFGDAEFLYKASPSRFPNADQLYGFAVECALKQMMQNHFQGKLQAGRNGGQFVHLPNRRAPVTSHVDHLWGEFCSLWRGRQSTPPIPIFSGQANPFDDWRIGDRYCHSQDIAAAAVAGRRMAAVEVLKYFEALEISYGTF